MNLINLGARLRMYRVLQGSHSMTFRAGVWEAKPPREAGGFGGAPGPPMIGAHNAFRSLSPSPYFPLLVNMFHDFPLFAIIFYYFQLFATIYNY